MLKTKLSNGAEVSVVGVGGHHKQLEDGRFEETYGPVLKEEIESRSKLVLKAVDSGINYFDTTWYSEVQMLAETLKVTGVRDKIHINGMVLGAFSGSKDFNMTDRDYFNKYLDKRLDIIPGNKFDSFMINAIDEQYDYERCCGLVELLQERKKAGDIGMIGFSCHNHQLAREIADKIPEFELIMTAYHFENRSFERCFETYKGNASFVAMKPMIWAQYGIPFCSINTIPDFDNKFGFNKVEDVATKAIRFSRTHPLINVSLCAVNNEKELDMLIAAGEGSNTTEDIDVLQKYRDAIFSDKNVPMFIGGMEMDSPRTKFFCINNLCDILGINKDALYGGNEGNADEVINDYKKMIYDKLKDSNFSRYI